MLYKYEFYICHSDHTWSDCHFIDVGEDNVRDWEENRRRYPETMDAMAIDLYKKAHPEADIVFIGIYNVEEIDETECEG